MPLTFPTSPTNGQTTTLSGTTYTYNATKGVWEATASGGGFVAGSFSEHILPSADDTYDIGSASNKIRDLYVSDNSLHIGDHTMSADSEGINIPALKLGTGSNRVKLMANAEGELRQIRTVGGVAQAEEGISSDAGTTTVDTFAELQAAPVVAGKTVLVKNTNKLYINTGTGWYVVGQVTNESPTAITGLDATYSLATDGTATVITMNSTDPEGFPLTWSHAVTTGTLGSTATITNVDNVFTITPSTTAADGGSFSVTFSASDGNQAATSVSAFTLNFEPWAAVSLETSLNSGSQYVNSYARSVDISGDKMVIGVPSAYSSGGYVYVSEWNGTVWQTPQQQLQANLEWNDADQYEGFGECVAIDGNYFIASAPLDGSGTRGSYKGAAYVFYYNGSSWTQQAKLLMEEYNPHNITDLKAGGSVDISGDYVAVGTPNMWYDGKSLSGLVTIYKRSGTTWSFVQYIKHPVSANNTFFGCDVSLEGNRLVVGEHARDGGQQGAVHIYEIVSGTTFTLQQTLLSPNVLGNGHFGSNVELSGDYLATTQSLTQQVFVYKKTGATWALEQTISDGNVSGDRFGGIINPANAANSGSKINPVVKGLRLDGNVLVITASGHNGGSSEDGKAIIYTRSGTTWTEQQTILSPSGSGSAGQFGWGVAKDGDHLAIAQPYGTGKGLYTYKPS